MSDAVSYRAELKGGLQEAVGKLAKIEGFVLYAFNIATEPQMGITDFSADTRRNSDRVVREMREWQQQTAQKLRSIGRDNWVGNVLKPIQRNQNPADFEYRSIVRLEHPDWNVVLAGSDGWELVESVLIELRDDAAEMIRQRLDFEPDAEVSIGTCRDWYDLPVGISPRSD